MKSMTNFQEQKTKQLERKDKSHEGKMDRAIVDLCRKINSRKEFYTTSSCAGRIILVKEKEKKGKNLFLFVSHEKMNFPALKKEIEKACKETKELVYFKQEPCILHVACENMEGAESLLEKARFAGWKRSGLIAKSKRIVLELMSTERIDLPIINRGKVLVDDNFLKLLVRETNKKLSRTREKIKKFVNLI